MKVAIIGSRNVNLHSIADFIPEKIAGLMTEIITGGAVGVDTLALKYARENNIKATILKPEYEKYKRGAPLIRNRLIVDASDLVIAIWDGKSRGTKYTIDYAEKIGKEPKIYILE